MTDAELILASRDDPRAGAAALSGAAFVRERSILVGLFDDTGERCFGLAELREHVLRKLAVTGREIRFKLGRMPTGTGIEPPRGDRYAEGCAIFVGAGPVYPAAGEVAVEAELWQEPADGD